jgi:gas vesicle protein
MNEHRNDMLPAFLLGALVGAGVALLLAPQSGEETRRQLGEKGRQLGEKGRQLADEAGNRLHGVKEELRSHKGDLGKAIAAGKEAFDKARVGSEPAPTSTVI